MSTDNIQTNSVADKTERDIQFDAILNNLSNFKNQITLLQQQIKSLDKAVNKEVKSLQKAANKNKNKGNRKPSGFAKSSKISDTLCSFMNKPIGTEMARTEVTKMIIGYIKEKGLQQENNKKFIKPDAQLRNLLGVGENDEVTYFNIQKYMNKHFTKTDEVSVEAS
jgi:chromatin remodeling complex protein RSC6